MIDMQSVVFLLNADSKLPAFVKNMLIHIPLLELRTDHTVLYSLKFIVDLLYIVALLVVCCYHIFDPLSSYITSRINTIFASISYIFYWFSYIALSIQLPLSCSKHRRLELYYFSLLNARFSKSQHSPQSIFNIRHVCSLFSVKC